MMKKLIKGATIPWKEMSHLQGIFSLHFGHSD